MHQSQRDTLSEFIKQNDQTMSGIVIMKDDKLVYEDYFNECHRDSRIHIYSVSKSVLSLLIGIAIDQGYIKDVQQKVLDFFPDYKVKKGNPTIHSITLEHLLTMIAPYTYKSSFLTYIKYFMSRNWINFTLNRLGGKGTIGEFFYTPLIGPDLLTGILAKATGQSAFDFAQEHLFQPLGITVERSLILKSAKQQKEFNKATDISAWVCDDTGTNAGGWGLTLSTRDMAKIAQLNLNKGMWEGQRIVSEQWLYDSLSKHSEWKEAQLSYGYLWWVIDEVQGIYAGLGDGGNTIYFNESKQLVVAISSLFVPKSKDRLDFIKTQIEPLFDITKNSSQDS